MTVTAQRILTELGNKAWSGFNADDMIFTSDDSIQARTELNGALRYLLNLEDFPFKAKTKDIIAMSGISDYTTPAGQIASVFDADSRNNLVFIGDPENYDKEETGAPSHYWINYNNPKSKLRLYPIPDADYNLTIVYSQFKPVKDADDGSLKFEFTKANDFINLPADLEFLFMDCLVLKTIEQNNKDEQDENYRPTINEFNERWQLFKKLAHPVKVNPRIVWNV
jgi:hypothetical protein